MPPNKPTIRDVAHEAGVSVTTVSHALNGVKTARIKDETRQRVEAAAQRLGYSPNGLARGLRRQRSQTLAFLSDRIVTTPYAGQIILGAQEKASELGWVVTLYSTGENPDVERREVRTLLKNQVDGVLYGAWYHRQVTMPAGLSVLPVVLVDCITADGSLSSVVPDEYGSGLGAVQELIDHGHREIGFVTNVDDIPATRGRLQGYRDALQAAGIRYRPSLVVADESETLGGYRTGLRLLTQRRRPTAIFAYNDRMAMGVYRAAYELNISIPRELSVVSIDNQDIIADGLYPGLTTLALPHYAMGAWAVHHLIGRLLAGEKGEPEPPVEHVILPCPIVRRGSVAAPVCGN
ncbi:LacI family DNA-binding transcriptional regulator [Pedococcus sp. 5OH_020]|uniref:LacI family DNA-binding transcriptional regulator n=1 Tax=Pedococcus sp. 5OH_020 TaxID=2989814 RepID=UPI0022E9FF93|nr:LacI family DNA-binding transcriptional regulator [Pedococcus sp. 5OH_020]